MLTTEINARVSMRPVYALRRVCTAFAVAARRAVFAASWMAPLFYLRVISAAASAPAAVPAVVYVSRTFPVCHASRTRSHPARRCDSARTGIPEAHAAQQTVRGLSSICITISAYAYNN